MTLYELGIEYEKRSAQLFKRIEQLRLKLKDIDDENAVALRRRICSLYADLEKGRQIGAKLKKYYDNT